MQAFRNSIALGVDLLECDVHLSTDGVPMVIHDATLDRTSKGHGPVGEQTAADLGRTALRGAEHGMVPRLDELLTLLADASVGLQIEIKGQARFDLLRAVLEVVDSAGLRQRTSIIAFDAPTAAAAVTAGGLAEVVWLFDAVTLGRVGAAGVIGTAAAHGIRTVESEIGAMGADLCATLRQEGLRLGAWGANGEASLKHAFAVGLDLVATDDPVLALKLRDG